jgi:hypothetical protein
MNVRCVTLLLVVSIFAPQARAGDLKDPTRPPIVVEVPTRHAEERKLPPHVSAIFMSSTRRIAVFDGHPVRAGEIVGVYHIDEVTAEGVRYTTSGRTAFAPLIAVRQPATPGSVR